MGPVLCDPPGVPIGSARPGSGSGKKRRVCWANSGYSSAARGSSAMAPARQRLGEEAAVVLDELGVLLRDAALLADGLDRTDRLAGTAVDALPGVDV